ncbi:MAG: PPC domain-containing DNA-binding protein [Chloroflexota bacterium]
MKSQLINSDTEKTYALIFDKGDEVMAGLTAFAKEAGLSGAHFTAIGAFTEATLGYFDRDRKDYKKIPIKEQVEVLSLVGDVALKDGDPQVHAHVVVGTKEGMARGGHILSATVWPTLEVIVTESPRHLRKKHDPETGLALIDLSASKPQGMVI